MRSTKNFRRALITGVTGQDGCYLARFLLNQGYEVHGTTRELTNEHRRRFGFLGIDNRIKIVETDLLEMPLLLNLFQEVEPDEIYNLAAQSSVGMSFEQPLRTLVYNLQSAANLFETLRLVCPKTNFYQASSSEMFGQMPRNSLPATEQHQLRPISPYAIAKASAHWLAASYRNAFGLFIASGILFNHESCLRGDRFVSKKIIASALAIQNGAKTPLVLGDLSIARDWGYAPKYVEGMWLMLQQSQPEDFIIASGEAHRLAEFAEGVFAVLGIDPAGKIQSDPKLFRPNEIEKLYGDNQLAKSRLGWDYSLTFSQFLEQLVRDEIDYRAWCSKQGLA